MADATVSATLQMHGARAAMGEGLAHIEEQVKGIERAVVENPGLAFDLAKTVVESTCRSILTERRIAFKPEDDLPRLFKSVTMALPMLPVTASGDPAARKSLAQMLNGLNTALHGVCELRNAYGFASHGNAGSRPALESVQALLAAQAADAIVGFLHRVHRQDRNTQPITASEYDDHADFNAYVDEANQHIQIFELTYRPSEVLFSVDQEAYRDLLSEFDTGNAEEPGKVVVAVKMEKGGP